MEQKRKSDLEMSAVIRWNQDVNFIAKSNSGHLIKIDGPEEFGGANLGPRPMEMILMGLGSCAAYDVLAILRKGKQKVLHCECTVEATRTKEIPAVFKEILMKFLVTGINLDFQKIERAVRLSKERYCSVSKMLEFGGVLIAHQVEIKQVEELKS